MVPGASRSVIDGLHGGRIKIRVTSPPAGGKANEEVARLLADLLASKVVLRTGMRGRAKVFDVPGTDVETVSRKLGL